MADAATAIASSSCCVSPFFGFALGAGDLKKKTDGNIKVVTFTRLTNQCNGVQSTSFKIFLRLPPAGNGSLNIDLGKGLCVFVAPGAVFCVNKLSLGHALGALCKNAKQSESLLFYVPDEFCDDVDFVGR